MRKAFVISCLALTVACGGKLPPVKVCPDGTVTTGECPRPSPPPSPAPTPTPSPVPTPVPTPSPSPVPTPPPPVGCGLPRGTGDGIGCPRESALFGDAVATAQEAAFAAREGVENGVIFDSERYHAAIVRHLIGQGFCAGFVDGEEISLKKTNDLSEQWDMESASRRAIRMYAATCRPAWSAIPSNGPAPSPSPSPSPSPGPPCVPQPAKVDCSRGCALFWQDALSRLDVIDGRTECHWFPVQNASLLIGNDSPPFGTMTPCVPDIYCCGWKPTPSDFAKAPRALDRQCNVLQMPGRNIVHRPQDGYLGDLGCEITPEVTCPEPGPDPPPLPEACPPLSCFGSDLHSVITPTGQISNDAMGRPKPCRGCRHVLDSTPYYERCGPNYRCNGEVNVVCGGRACEDPRGGVWRQLSGPRAECEGGNRGYLCRLVLSQPGAYSFGVCAGGDFRSPDGALNSNQAACERAAITFVVP